MDDQKADKDTRRRILQNEHGVLCSGRDAVCNQILMEATKIIKIMSAFDSWASETFGGAGGGFD